MIETAALGKPKSRGYIGLDPPSFGYNDTSARSWILRNGVRPVAQDCYGLSDTSLSLSAIRPSSGSESAFILSISLLRYTFTVATAIPRS